MLHTYNLQGYSNKVLFKKRKKKSQPQFYSGTLKFKIVFSNIFEIIFTTNLECIIPLTTTRLISMHSKENNEINSKID